MTETQTAPTTQKSFDLYQEVTNTIINQLEAGTIPWQQSWVNKQQSFAISRNAVTGNDYRGINIVLLWSANGKNKFTTNDWASLKQWNSKKQSIRKNEKSSMIVYTDTFEKEQDGEIKKIPFLKYSRVFNRCQLEGFAEEKTEPSIPVKSLAEKIDHIEDFVGNTLAEIEHREGGACYIPSQDKIQMPLLESFIDTKTCKASENYYSVLFHELTHWTGHTKRMDRKIRNKFGDHAYAEEELIAELGAAFLASEFSISTPEKKNHASYIASWLKVLKDNKQFIISAASEASKAVEFMKDKQPLKF